MTMAAGIESAPGANPDERVKGSIGLTIDIFFCYTKMFGFPTPVFPAERAGNLPRNLNEQLLLV